MEVTIVGGGLAGLVAAIDVAREGVRATLHEASPYLGGRARSHGGSYRASLGPHALYRHGALERWLRERELVPPVAAPLLRGSRLLSGDRLRRLPLPLLPMLRKRKERPPPEISFREWARERMGERGAEAAIGFASLPTLHGDPGRLSAAFVQERLQRTLVRDPVYYVLGSWDTLVERLEARARELGVVLETRSKVTRLPEGPTIVATDLPAARRLLEAPSLDWPGPRTALFDVALRPRRGDPLHVLDVDRRVFVSNYSANDSSLAPPGEALLQTHTGLGPDEGVRSGVARIQEVLDLAFPDWRSRAPWSRQGVVEAGAGAADPPGTSWRDRPAVECGGGLFLCGDRVAAPGLLSEVSVASAERAARAAAAAARGRTPAPKRHSPPADEGKAVDIR